MSEDVIPKRHAQDVIRRAVEFAKTLPREDDYDSWSDDRVEEELRARHMTGSHSCYLRGMDPEERARCDRSAGVALLRYMDRIGRPLSTRFARLGGQRGEPEPDWEARYFDDAPQAPPTGARGARG